MSLLPDSDTILLNPTLLRDEITHQNFEQLNSLLTNMFSETVVIPNNLLAHIFVIVQRYIENHPNNFVLLSDQQQMVVSTMSREMFTKMFMDRLFDSTRIFSPFFCFEFRGMNEYYLRLYELVLRHNFGLFFIKKNYRIRSCKIYERSSGCCFGKDYNSIKIKISPNMDVKEGKYNNIVVRQIISLDLASFNCFNDWDIKTTYTTI